jgi:Family of unknown function (DUF5313)
VRDRRLSGAAARPPLTGRVYYLIGGTLPPAYADWVARDCSGPGWRARQAARPVVLLAPFALVFLLLPGAMDARVTTAVLILATAVAVGFGGGGYFRNRRLVQHGLPPVVARDEDPQDADPPGADPSGADADYSASANVSMGISTRAASVIEPDSDG